MLRGKKAQCPGSIDLQFRHWDMGSKETSPTPNPSRQVKTDGMQSAHPTQCRAKDQAAVDLAGPYSRARSVISAQDQSNPLGIRIGLLIHHLLGPMLSPRAPPTVDGMRLLDSPQSTGKPMPESLDRCRSRHLPWQAPALSNSCRGYPRENSVNVGVRWSAHHGTKAVLDSTLEEQHFSTQCHDHFEVGRQELMTSRWAARSHGHEPIQVLWMCLGE
jgi:hypothetical protein